MFANYYVFLATQSKPRLQIIQYSPTL